MKCSWGGCQTDAVVIIQPLAEYDYAGFEPKVGTQPRAACRSHMAVLCEPDPYTGNAYFLVTPVT